MDAVKPLQRYAPCITRYLDGREPTPGMVPVANGEFYAVSEFEGRLALPAWQPIETAPTNERVLVLLKPQPFQVVGEITFGYFTLSTDIPGGVWTYDETGDVCCPQFWMPLPPPPAAEGA